jgi:ribosome-binding factor A
MSRRTARVAEAIREVVSTAILFEVKDPRVSSVTVIGCEASGDLRHCKVRVSIMGDDAKRSLVMHGLKSSTGFLQRRIADRLQLRYTPILTIVEDDSVKKSLEMARLLREANPPAASEDDEPGAETPDEATVDDGLESPPRP